MITMTTQVGDYTVSIDLGDIELDFRYSEDEVQAAADSKQYPDDMDLELVAAYMARSDLSEGIWSVARGMTGILPAAEDLDVGRVTYVGVGF